MRSCSMHYYQMVDHGNITISFFMGFIGLLLIVLLIVTISKISKDRDIVKPKKDQGLIQNKSIEIVKERYAKGEINKDEFTELKKDLL